MVCTVPWCLQAGNLINIARNTLSTRHTHTHSYIHTYAHTHALTCKLTRINDSSESSASWHNQLYGTNRVVRLTFVNRCCVCSVTAVIFPTGSVSWWRLVSLQWPPALSSRHRRAASHMVSDEALALWFATCVVCCECKYAYSVCSVTPIQYTDYDAGFCTPVRLRDNPCYC